MNTHTHTHKCRMSVTVPDTHSKTTHKNLLKEYINSIISSYISDANFELKLSATIMAMPSAVRHGRLESLPCLCVDR